MGLPSLSYDCPPLIRIRLKDWRLSILDQLIEVRRSFTLGQDETTHVSNGPIDCTVNRSTQSIGWVPKQRYKILRRQRSQKDLHVVLIR